MKSSVLSCLICTIILSCCAGGSIEDTDSRPADGITMATPKGEKLEPAEEGPERSVLGRHKVDLDNFELSISGLVDSPFSVTWEEIQEMPAFYTGKMVTYCIEGWEVLQHISCCSTRHILPYTDIYPPTPRSVAFCPQRIRLFLILGTL